MLHQDCHSVLKNNSATFTAALSNFAALLHADQLRGLVDSGVDCEANRADRVIHLRPGKKFIKVDVGSSGRYMVEVATGNVFGTKGYGVVHRGHWYGTLDTVAEYDWSQYYPSKKDGSTRTQRGNCPVITKAPEVVS